MQIQLVVDWQSFLKSILSVFLISRVFAGYTATQLESTFRSSPVAWHGHAMKCLPIEDEQKWVCPYQVLSLKNCVCTRTGSFPIPSEAWCLPPHIWKLCVRDREFLLHCRFLESLLEWSCPIFLDQMDCSLEDLNISLILAMALGFLC